MGGGYAASEVSGPQIRTVRSSDTVANMTELAGFHATALMGCSLCPGSW